MLVSLYLTINSANELEALEKNETWEMIELPKGKNATGSKWDNKTKLLPTAEIERLKRRKVSHWLSFATVRTVIAVAVIKGRKLCHLDVNNVFLHGHLVEEV